MEFVFSVIDRQQAMDPLRQDVTAVLEECYSRGMQLPYLFVAVSLDGKVMGVRFTEAEEGDGLDAQAIAMTLLRGTTASWFSIIILTG